MLCVSSRSPLMFLLLLIVESFQMTLHLYCCIILVEKITSTEVMPQGLFNWSILKAKYDVSSIADLLLWNCWLSYCCV